MCSSTEAGLQCIPPHIMATTEYASLFASVFKIRDRNSLKSRLPRIIRKILGICAPKRWLWSPSNTVWGFSVFSQRTTKTPRAISGCGIKHWRCNGSRRISPPSAVTPPTWRFLAKVPAALRRIYCRFRHTPDTSSTKWHRCRERPIALLPQTRQSTCKRCAWLSLPKSVSNPTQMVGWRKR